MQSYKDLEVYQLAHTLAIEIHKMTQELLPKFAMFTDLYQHLIAKYEELGKKLYRFRETVIQDNKTVSKNYSLEPAA